MTAIKSTNQYFSDHRVAALALLSSVMRGASFSHKEAGFLGHCCVAGELTERQQNWLVSLLDRATAPAANGEVAA